MQREWKSTSGMDIAIPAINLMERGWRLLLSSDHMGTEWATGDEERLIKLTIRGLYGPMELNGTTYEGLVPMTPFGGLLKDDEVAAVLTYVRNSFGNEASVITSEKVTEVRAAIEGKKGYYSPEELLKEHPLSTEL